LSKHPADTKDYNDNIEKIVYIKKEFFEILADPENPLENLWKKRILIENTPRGNIYMYYDIFETGIRLLFRPNGDTVPHLERGGHEICGGFPLYRFFPGRDGDSRRQTVTFSQGFCGR
jgi:hypothetical protein